MEDEPQPDEPQSDGGQPDRGQPDEAEQPDAPQPSPPTLFHFFMAMMAVMCQPQQHPPSATGSLPSSGPSQSQSTAEVRPKRRPAKKQSKRQRAGNSPRDPTCRMNKRLPHRLVKYDWGPAAEALQKVKRKGPSRRCVVCQVMTKERHETRYYCEVCKTALCNTGNCFADFHSKRYSRALERLAD